MPNSNLRPAVRLAHDLTAGVVVFLVALPLCLGIAIASGAPVISGVLAGIIGGVLVGILSGSHTSVSGPAAGLTAFVAAQIILLKSFEAFLLAVVIAGLIQVALGIARAGFLSAFFPSSVIKGLLAAIGVILILKQIPHLLGHDADPEGQMAFDQPDQQNTFTEILELFGDLHPGAAAIGLLSVAVLVLWDLYKPLRRSNVPPALVVVLLGVSLSLLFQRIGGMWVIDGGHLVQLPEAKTLDEFRGFLTMPDFRQWQNPDVYKAALTIAVVASLETLLNLNAVDKIDPQQRVSPPNRELIAQGLGNIAAGLVGAIPITTVIVRSSVNISSGARTRLATVTHGVLLLGALILLPRYVNVIPLACLAAILLVTGFKLANWALLRQMWSEGRYQFIPFAVTLIAIVLSDMLVGIMIGLATSLSFILNSNLRRPVRRVSEKHLGGEVLHIELANQVSFLNRAALEKTLREVPRGGHVLIDASSTDYIDPDVQDLLRDFRETIAPAHGVQVSMRGFRDKYPFRDEIQYVDYSTRELQEQLTSAQVLNILLEGNERFRAGRPLSRDFGRQMDATAKGQHPLAVVLSCIDSRTPSELIFDLGLGDIFSVRLAGNVISRKVLGSMEYGCAVAGAKLILVIGHSRCGAVTAAFDLRSSPSSVEQATGCQHLEQIIQEIQLAFDGSARTGYATQEEKSVLVDLVSRRNVQRTVREIHQQSQTISKLVREGRVAVVGAFYDVASGRIELLDRGTI